MMTFFSFNDLYLLFRQPIQPIHQPVNLLIRRFDRSIIVFSVGVWL
ncbi:MAG: hypothetical protein HUU38_31160 [Anaerolineales bacterium]|nr:hypothetical protein [Anaerolineales bacterium]